MGSHRNPINTRAPSHTHVHLYTAQNKVMVVGRVIESAWENSGNVKYKGHSGEGARGATKSKKTRDTNKGRGQGKRIKIKQKGR